MTHSKTADNTRKIGVTLEHGQSAISRNDSNRGLLPGTNLDKGLPVYSQTTRNRGQDLPP